MIQRDYKNKCNVYREIIKVQIKVYQESYRTNITLNSFS